MCLHGVSGYFRRVPTTLDAASRLLPIIRLAALGDFSANELSLVDLLAHAKGGLFIGWGKPLAHGHGLVVHLFAEGGLVALAHELL